jgi:hypothetical protein
VGIAEEAELAGEEEVVNLLRGVAERPEGELGMGFFGGEGDLPVERNPRLLIASSIRSLVGAGGMGGRYSPFALFHDDAFGLEIFLPHVSGLAVCADQKGCSYPPCAALAIGIVDVDIVIVFLNGFNG